MEMNLKFETQAILKALKKHREAHIKNYKIALKKYNKLLVEVLKRKLTLAKKFKKVSHNINLPVPILYVGEYHKLIDLFILTTDTTVELSYDDSRKIFFDEWHWRSNFQTNTMCYTGAQGPTGPTGATGSCGSIGSDGEGEDLL
jgi:hypothetical protein